LVLRGGSLPEGAFEDLVAGPHCPRLLYVEGVPLAAGALSAATGRRLEALSLKDTGIPFEDGSVDALVAMRLLRYLDLSGTGIRDEDLTKLAAYGPPLEELRLSRTYLSAARLDKVSRMASLRALDLSDTRADSGTLGRFDDLHRLRRLDLRATAVEDPGAAELAKNPSLVELDAPFWLTGASAPHLAKLKMLRVLRARAVRFHATDLVHLGALGELVLLELNHVDVTDEGVAGLLPAAALEILELEHCPVGDRGMEVVAEMPRLRKLEIEESNVRDAGFAALARAPALEVIKARELSGLTDAGMVSVPALTKLTALVLDETEVSDAAVPLLAKAPGLRLLSLETTRVSPEGKQRLRAALPNAEIR